MGANPNTLTDDFPKYWSKRMQVTRFKVNQYHVVANYEEKATLKKGNTVTRPYRSTLVVNTMGADGSYTRQALTDTEETLVINYEKEVSFYVKELDEIQNNFSIRNEYADDCSKLLTNYIDGVVFGEYDQAASKIGNYELGGGGSAGDGIGFALTTSNVLQVFGKANKKLDNQNIARTDRWAIISPEFYDILWQFIAGKESILGDKTGEMGNIGEYGGFRLYISNNLGWSGSLAVGTLATNADTVTINGVVFTFVTGSPTNPGDVKAETSGAVCIDNLVAAINAPGTTTANFIALSAANQKLLSGIVATDGTSVMTLKATGKSYVVVSETLTAAADIWTTTKQIQHQLFGQGKPIDLVIQKDVNMITKSRDGFVGNDIVTWGVFGKKTFVEGTKQLVDVQTRSDAY
jgi:hypothetical protein